MKFLAYLVVTSMISSASAMVHTALWSAPQVTESFLTVSQNDQTMREGCKTYRKMVSESVSMDSQRLDKLRKLPLRDSSIEVLTFRREMRLEGNWKDDETLEYDVSQPEKPFSPLSFNRSTTTVAPLTAVLKILPSENSLTAVSRKYGLPDSLVEWSGQSLVVHGRDVACDLLNGELELYGLASSYITLVREDFEQMENFYQRKVSPVINEVWNTKVSKPSKAARMGFRLGLMIENEYPRILNDQTEDVLRKIMDAAFVSETFEFSSHTVLSDRQRYFKLDPTSEGASVKITIGMGGNR